MGRARIQLLGAGGAAWFEMQAALQFAGTGERCVVVDAGHGLEIEHVPALVEARTLWWRSSPCWDCACQAHIEWLRRNGERNMARAQEPPRPGEEWKPIVGVPGRVIGVLCVEPPAVAKGRGAVSLEEARKYLQMEHMECELMGRSAPMPDSVATFWRAWEFGACIGAMRACSAMWPRWWSVRAA